MARRVDGDELMAGSLEVQATLLASGLLQVTGSILQTGNLKVVTSQFNKTNNTLADITGLSVAIPASGSFIFKGKLFIKPAAVSAVGSKVGVAYSGTTSTFRAYSNQYFGPNITAGYITAVGLISISAGSVAGTEEFLDLYGFLVSTGAGNLTLQFAQNTTNASQSSVLTGSSLEVVQVA